MIDLIDINFANEVRRTDELCLHIPSQVAAIEESEWSVFEEEHHAVFVIRGVFGLFFGETAELVRWLRFRFDEMLLRAEATQADPGRCASGRNGNGVAGRDYVPLLHLHLAIRFAHFHPARIVRTSIRVFVWNSVVPKIA